MLNSDELQDIAINQYFGNVDKKNIDGVLATLNKDAAINIFFSIRRFVEVLYLSTLREESP